MTIIPRLTQDPVLTVWNGGSVIDMAQPDAAVVCFHEIANTLSKIARFNGRNDGPAFSVAQHCTMGAQALENERHGTLPARLFLLHDAHEWILGDLITPAAQLYAKRAGSPQLLDVIAECKAGWDEAIYEAADLPGPSRWTNQQRQLVKGMDGRMLVAEAVALFGPGARAKFPKWSKPLTTGEIKPWKADRAEREFKKLAYRLIGEDRILHQASVSAVARALR
ncbi:hypothetical protein P6U16_08535 [Rhizobium sp. 32-5/1]|uniref:hypothetical protein n=1 Tax=Rhizobium sp. 32-5/1 TaxID=3019602 RepID=UPI00240E873B|nr:hypothetical protein [Rhizobium sp. 32-5/1]WEZ84605.1 hypothetical protein P6U16_08535 [Rhizobium sp. 32-5/1]